MRKNFFTKRLVEIYKALLEKLVEAGTLMISKCLSEDMKCPAMSQQGRYWKIELVDTVPNGQHRHSGLKDPFHATRIYGCRAES